MNFLKSSPSLDLSSYFFDIDPWAWLASLYSHHRKESRLYSLFCFSVRYVPYIYQSIWNEKTKQISKYSRKIYAPTHHLVHSQDCKCMLVRIFKCESFIYLISYSLAISYALQVCTLCSE